MSTIARTTDWEYLQHKYVTGEGTLEDLARLPNAPHVVTIKKRSTAEGWTAAREDYRNRTATKVREMATTSEAEVSARHVKIAQALQSKALQALQRIDVSKLPPAEVRQFLATATDIERKALGMDNKSSVSIKAEVRHVDEDPERAALARQAAAALEREWETAPGLN